MTCIVGLSDSGRVYIGGDSAGVGGLDLIVRSDEKVFRKGDFLFGFTSSFRMGQILRYSLTPPPKADETPEHEYLCTAFVDSVRAALKSGGYASKNNETESAGTFLIGWKGKVYRVESDYQVGLAIDGFDACGCGAQIARGSLYSTRGRDPRTRVQLALEAAERFSAGVRAPFTILESAA